jgi:hypothetical protein
VSDLDQLHRQIAALDPDQRVALARWLIDSLPDGVVVLSERSTLVDKELQRESIPVPLVTQVPRAG